MTNIVSHINKILIRKPAMVSKLIFSNFFIFFNIINQTFTNIFQIIIQIRFNKEKWKKFNHLEFVLKIYGKIEIVNIL